MKGLIGQRPRRNPAGGRQVVVVKGLESPEFGAVVRNGPSFHPDGVLEFLGIRGDVLYRVTVPPAG